MTAPVQPPSFTIPPQAPAQPTAPRWPLWGLYVAAVLSGSAIAIWRLGPAIRETPTLAAVGVVAFGAFDLDDIRPQISHQRRRIWPGKDTGEIKDAQVGQRFGVGGHGGLAVDYLNIRRNQSIGRNNSSIYT